ncbi:MAG: alginate export family protein [Bacteroidales bacterium]|nr:alginate export family protein [Bacteroidales bacterium]
MKKKYFKLHLIALIIGLFSTLETYSQFKIDAQYRPRLEVRDGYQKLAKSNSVPAFLMSQRTRISFIFESENFKIKLTPQDVRIWGDEQLASSSGVYGDKASLDLFEAFVEMKVGNSIWISLGRQQLVYDNERLLSARNWNQNGIAYDAFVFKFGKNKWNIHAGFSWNSLEATLENNYYLSNRIKSLNFLWINRNINDKLKLSLSQIASGVTETDTTNTLHFRQTTGVYLNYKRKILNFNGDIYYQYGKNKTGKNISAFLIDANVSLKFGKIIPGLGISYLSGNKNPEGKTDNLFDVLYGARHRFFGHMDYFRDFVKNTNEGGLSDFNFFLEYKFDRSISLTNIGHYFKLAQLNPLTGNNKNLGYENEVMLKYKINDFTSIKSGYVFFLPTESFKKLQNVSGDRFSQFFYLELTIIPTLFKHL